MANNTRNNTKKPAPVKPVVEETKEVIAEEAPVEATVSGEDVKKEAPIVKKEKVVEKPVKKETPSIFLKNEDLIVKPKVNRI